ncbi:MAG: EthD domain-containing protein [Alphaproteobacteria bacterium]|nr:EthD domain-containing protein [Alphaproteobacteria bacterium]MBT4965025.1 EthD domain-containing protein [Alphaproteobacteria bacterium]MBT5161088.1 EthD domain-containing protein [Alphaproteobacteria bacterium]MBT6387139.1 EthD domain-containing protein [Alphaproteobacteria bacterium]
MIKLTFCLRRLPHLSLAEFQLYWCEKHGPLMDKHKAALGFVRYAQVHRIEDEIGDALRAIRDAPEPYDGIVETFWNSRADLEHAMTSKEGRAAGRELLADEKNFIDLAHSPIWLGEDRYSVDG